MTPERGGGPDAGMDVADVAIIGAGVVGTAIARTLAACEVSCVLIDAASDVGTGTTKANTAILHTGFDAPPGSLEARLLTRGRALLHAYAARAGILPTRPPARSTSRWRNRLRPGPGGARATVTRWRPRARDKTVTVWTASAPSEVELVVTGRSARIRARLPLRWHVLGQ